MFSKIPLDKIASRDTITSNNEEGGLSPRRVKVQVLYIFFNYN